MVFVAAVVCCTLGVFGCEAEEKKAETKAPEEAPAASAPAAAPAEEAKAPEAAAPAAPVEEAKAPEAAAPEAPEEEAKAPEAAAPAAEEVKVAEATPEAAAPAAAPEAGAKGGGVKDPADGKYRLPDGTLTYNVEPDGTVDWYTYSGYKRYHDNCHVCHGPGAEGSTFAPALKDSLKTMDYQTFVTTVMSGRIRHDATTEYVMPSFGDNKNVACFIDDLYAYIKSRSTEDVPFGRPEKREDKPQAAKDYEDACFGP